MENNQNLYRVNPFCPKCGEEHAYFTIGISDEEQKILDDYYEEHKHETHIAIVLSGPPLIVSRTFKCPMCSAIYEKNVGIFRSQKVGHIEPGVVPMGIVPID